jgi:LysM repeat protein
MHEREENPKENFVMSGPHGNGEEREESYEEASQVDSGARKSLKPVLIAGAGLLAAVVVLLMVFSGSPRTADKEQFKNLEARLKILEEKLAKLDWIDTGMARLDRREKEITSLAERLNQMESAFSRKIDQLSKEPPKPQAKAPEAPAAKTESQAAKAEAPSPKPAPAPPKVEKETKGRIHVVQKGETVYGIGRRYGLSVEQVLKLNNLTLKDPIKPGQKLVVSSGN